MSFPFHVQPEHGFSVLRDDLIAGGTKRRALDLLLRDMEARRIFYAGTVKGHGALALACACESLGKQAVIFINGTEDDPAIIKLRHTNADMHLCPPAPVESLFQQAKAQAGADPVLPPGFAMPAFEQAMEKALSGFVADGYPEIWTTAVSGTLTRALARVFPAIPLRTVKAARNAGALPSASVYDAPEKYHQAARTKPPYPACPYTDAKLWQFARDHAVPGALIWNTAG